MRQKGKGSEVMEPLKGDVMEKIPAACSMEWSVELEKGLRSKTPSKRIDAISQTVAKLEWWNRQCSISGAEYKMFGLVPSEDKLFLNAILLRLADAFRTGDKHTKFCIVKSFMQAQNSASREIKEKSSIFFKYKLDNCLEVLRRVKMVFDDGDVEDRALALYLFGCWADFAKDHAAIRYCILSSSVSDDALEVKASFFAAGCFSVLADDFARVFLNILCNRLYSVDTSPVIKSVGCQVLSKMQCSYSLANRAYEAGLKLLLDSSHQEFSIGMLISLTKIASRWTMLIPAHMELLSNFLVKEDAALCLQVTTLKCLQCVLASGSCPSLAARGVIRDMVDVVRRSKYSSALLGKALKVLHVIVCYYLPTFHASEMLDVLTMLFGFIENLFKSSTMSERIFSVWILLDIVGKFMGRGRLESKAVAHTLAHQVITFVMDHISALLNACDGKHQLDEKTGQEVTHLLRLLLNLVENHFDVRGLVLHKIPNLMKHLVNVLGDVCLEKEGSMDCDISECTMKDKRHNFLDFVFLLTKMMNICLGNLEEDYDTHYEVLDPVKLLVGSIMPSVSFQLDTRSTYMFLLHFRDAYVCMWKETKHDQSCGDSITKYDSLAVEYGNKLCERRDYWSSYKAGKLAACHGSWSTATFIFEQLLKLDLSDSNKLWLQSFVLISRSERQLESFGFFATEDSLLREREGIAPVSNWSHCVSSLDEAISGLRTAERALDTSILALSTKFQKWFLVLRAKFLEIMKDAISLLGGVSFTEDSDSSMQQEAIISSPIGTPLERLCSLARSLSQISHRLNEVANEYDLLAISFAGMDRNSATRISELAASCSLLAFSTGFALSVPYWFEDPSCVSDGSEAQFHSMLLYDILDRLCLTESETRKSLFMLSKIYKTQSQHKTLSNCCRERSFIRASRYAVMEITNLNNGEKVLHSDQTVSKLILDVSKLLSNLICKGMHIHIPLKCPSFYFRVGNSVQSELFLMNEDGETLEGMSVSSGRPLSLNVCLQVKNMPVGLLARVAKLYCIISCRIQSESECDGIFELNGKLARYVISGSSNNSGRNSGSVEEYLHFVPNGRGQGFSSCLLDISGFPVGAYRIRWQSCFVDDDGSYRSLLPLNDGSSFIVADSSGTR